MRDGVLVCTPAGSTAYNLSVHGQVQGNPGDERIWLHKLRRAILRPGRDKLTSATEVYATCVGGVEVKVRGRGPDRIRMSAIPDVSAAGMIWMLSLCSLAIFLAPGSAWAQSRYTGATLEAPSNEAPGGAANAERLLRLEKAIRSDRKRLVQLQLDLKQRPELFDELATRQAQLDTEIGEKRQELSRRKDAGDSAAVIILETEIEKLGQRLELIREQSELNFLGAKTLQVQITALEEKIDKDQKAIDELTGVLPAVQAGESATEPAVTPQAEKSESSAPSLLPVPFPGSQTTPAAPVTRTTGPVPDTAQQIEARQDADKRAVKAQQAGQVVIDFLQRKAALEEQIKLEQEMLQSARASRDNLDRGLQLLRGELQQEISAGASQAELAGTRQDIEKSQMLFRATRQQIDDRRERLDSLHARLEKVQQDQLQLTREAEERHIEAQAARRKVSWLESPLHPQNLWNWITTRGPRILLVIGVTALLLFLVRFSVRRVARTVVRGTRGARTSGTNRADTLALSFRSAVSVMIVIAAILLVFQEAGVDIKTVLGGAAILGIAVAFGAQNLMRDYFTGFMILLEDQFELGDLITIGSITGTVEKVNMRTTMLRDLEGRVHFIPNGEIKSVTNRTYVWGRAVVEVPVSYKEDVDRVMKVLLEVAEELREDPEFGDSVTDVPVMLGVDKFTDYGVVIKLMLKTRPDQMFPVRRELLRRIKNRFDETGIEISVPHRIIHQQQPGQS